MWENPRSTASKWPRQSRTSDEISRLKQGLGEGCKNAGDGKCSIVERRARRTEETRTGPLEGFYNEVLNIRCLVQYEIQVEEEAGPDR